MRRGLPLAALLCCWTVLPAARCGGRGEIGPEAWAARVNGSVVTWGQTADRFRWSVGFEPDRARDVPQIARILDDLVTEELLVQEAERTGINLSDRELTMYARFLGEPGRGDDQPEGPDATAIRRRLLGEKLLKRAVYERIVIPEPRLRREYEQRRSELIRPPRFRLLHILVDDAGLADDLRGRIEAGADFRELAIAHSQAPEGPLGGALGPLAIEEIPDDLRAGIRQTRPGGLTRVLRSDYGYHLFRVVEATRERLPSFEEARAEIEAGLVDREKSAAQRAYINRLRTAARIEINEEVSSVAEQP